ncbi:Formate/nitrite transporter [Auriculariales sp. MPI-PUGE-AT-0066]|nr:Formate/nitrite transporter [Auriculariales sp. MPI-PUGE-AT-0066]
MTHSPAEVAAMLVNLAVSKHRQRPLALFLKAFNAGVFVSFGGLMSLIVAGGSPTLASENPGLVKLLSGFVFPIGLVMIILQQQELLTSNMMVFPMALAKRAVPWWGLPRNWFIVFFGNLAGSLFVSLVLVRYSGVVSSEPYVSYIKAAVIARCINPSWAQVFLRGWGVIGSFASRSGQQGMTAKDVTSKVVAVWFPIWAFVACSFEHVVANMFLMPLGMSLGGGDLTVGQFIAKPIAYGNFVGKYDGSSCRRRTGGQALARRRA